MSGEELANCLAIVTTRAFSFSPILNEPTGTTPMSGHRARICLLSDGYLDLAYYRRICA